MNQPIVIKRTTVRKTLSCTLFCLLVGAGIVLLPASGLHTFPAPAAAMVPFSFENVIREARELSERPALEPKSLYPEWLLDLSYDQWRDIRFRPEQALWRKENLPFQVQFFHPGFLYDRTVEVCIVENGRSLPFNVTSDHFDYGKNALSEGMARNVGAAGFRIHTLLNTRNYFDEFLVFLGASYFRAVAKDQLYGLSARGLALDTAMPRGEEFPWFRRFWIVKPRLGDKELTVYALLDSHSVSGAYSFRVKPGPETIISINSVIFLRNTTVKLGIAPLTSMFLFGENTSPRTFMDYRPEVHDSDGLQIAFASGEWLWRPLQNPSSLMVNMFQAPEVKGFGLLQRDTGFGSYEDLETRYERRPSVWIEPRGSWGQGHVELVQIPTPNEINDNIVAYWVPEGPLPLHQPLRFEYDLRWVAADMLKAPAGKVVATRQNKGMTERHRAFIIDFEGKPLQDLTEREHLDAVITMSGGASLTEHQVFKNPVTGGWRLVFQILVDEQSALDKVLPDKKRPVELRAFLRHGRDVLTETWSFAVKP
jgi:periplasmic glucans biosynthesis protein